ncbi:MAG: class I SAM-dependent methyltransferase [Thermoplasmata archaeon]|nr:class I SAM-dependent methyltransferase [Thermoplasmata archaeon]
MTASKSPSRARRRSAPARGLPDDLRKSWAETYAKTPYRDLPWFSEKPFPSLVRAVEERQILPPGPLLDVGCGAGTNALWLAGQGFRVTGVDISPGAVEGAQRRAQAAGLPAEFRVADALNLPFPRGQFKVVTDVGCFHTLPIPLREGYVHEVHRVLKPGGTYLPAWIAREATQQFGPPHRLSVGDMATYFEHEFIFAETEYGPTSPRGAWRTRRGLLPSYSARLLRRSKPQPPPR